MRYFNIMYKPTDVVVTKADMLARLGDRATPEHKASLPEQTIRPAEDFGHPLQVGGVPSAKTCEKAAAQLGDDLMYDLVQNYVTALLDLDYSKRQIRRVITLECFWETDLTKYSDSARNFAVLYGLCSAYCASLSFEYLFDDPMLMFMTDDDRIFDFIYNGVQEHPENPYKAYRRSRAEQLALWIAREATEEQIPRLRKFAKRCWELNSNQYGNNLGFLSKAILSAPEDPKAALEHVRKKFHWIEIEIDLQCRNVPYVCSTNPCEILPFDKRTALKTDEIFS